ncbi:MAG: hypothetical protein E5V25_05405 [Mesorhizobium sp.]|nr:MAG: hypothetical protein EOQ43_19465 [Mesorhizobium sp.]TGT98915.1 hypothetical protein EN807_02960 [Mesorhizobium sp. M5C.F.Ca.ET.164.01.1.1]RWB32899.1 MAG: hypothetical protein EOQ41_11565 [Mesorhizobium sp.]RWB78108.1 MAG: hypothetical protein EOQ42_08790 [Mesorhizobium sp.]RWC22255.1 MAG: hypothetical protein EOS51_10740 [Mesorhizobium sp.]
MDLYTAHKCVTIVAYTVLTFVSHHLLRPEPSVAALAEGDAALNGLGLACLPDHALRPFLAEGRLQQVLEDWCLLSRPGTFGLDLKPNAQRRAPRLGFRGQ